MNDVLALLRRLDYQNWFTQLAVLADAFRDAGSDDLADRCDDLRLCGKQPYFGIGFTPWTGRPEEWTYQCVLPKPTYEIAMRLVPNAGTAPAVAWLEAYLTRVPEELRLDPHKRFGEYWFPRSTVFSSDVSDYSVSVTFDVNGGRYCRWLYGYALAHERSRAVQDHCVDVLRASRRYVDATGRIREMRSAASSWDALAPHFTVRSTT